MHASLNARLARSAAFVCILAAAASCSSNDTNTTPLPGATTTIMAPPTSEHDDTSTLPITDDPTDDTADNDPATTGTDENETSTTRPVADDHDFTPTGNSVRFTDPDGQYTLDAGDWWRQDIDPTMVPEGVETWTIAELIDGYSANVNVLTFPTGNMTMNEFVTESLANMGGFEAVDSGVVTGDDGVTLGYLEYTGTGTGDGLHLLAYVVLDKGQASVVTLTAKEAQFDTQRGINEPFLRSIRPATT